MYRLYCSLVVGKHTETQKRKLDSHQANPYKNKEKIPQFHDEVKSLLIPTARRKVFRLNSVPEESSIIAPLPLQLLLVIGVLLRLLGVLAVPAGILPAKIESHENAQASAHGEGTDKSAVADIEMGLISAAIDETGNGTTQVTETDVHSDTNTTLDATANVVAVPGDTLGYVGVDTGSGEESAGVLDVVVVGADLHDEAADTVGRI